MAGQHAASDGSTAVTPDAIMQLGTAYWGSKTLSGDMMTLPAATESIGITSLRFT